MTTVHHNPALSGRIISTFFYYVIPSSIGLVAITTANVVDGIFVGHYVGANALAVITLLVPYFTLLIATALMFAIGGSVSAGKSIGEGNTQNASAIFSQSLIAIVVISSVFALLSLEFDHALYRFLQLPEDLKHLADQYFSVIRWVLIIQLFTMVLYYFVRADGHPLLATSALVVGALINIGLDAWFVIYLNKGLAGAAYATAIAQVIQLAILCSYFLSKTRTLSFYFIHDQWSRLVTIAYNGLSEFINELSVGFIFLLLNGLLIARIGINGVAAFSIANYFIFLSIMLCYGIADALHLVVSQNYGAKNNRRIEKFLMTALCSTLTVGLSIIIILFQYQHTIISWFLDTKDMAIVAMTTELLLIIWPLFLVNGINITISCYLTAIHQPAPSALIAVTRSLLLPATLLIIFYLLLDYLQTVTPLLSDWSFMYALPLAEWCAFILASFLYSRYKPSLMFK